MFHEVCQPSALILKKKAQEKEKADLYFTFHILRSFYILFLKTENLTTIYKQ